MTWYLNIFQFFDQTWICCPIQNISFCYIWSQKQKQNYDLSYYLNLCDKLIPNFAVGAIDYRLVLINRPKKNSTWKFLLFNNYLDPGYL